MEFSNYYFEDFHQSFYCYHCKTQTLQTPSLISCVTSSYTSLTQSSLLWIQNLKTQTIPSTLQTDILHKGGRGEDSGEALYFFLAEVKTLCRGGEPAGRRRWDLTWDTQAAGHCESIFVGRVSHCLTASLSVWAWRWREKEKFEREGEFYTWIHAVCCFMESEKHLV